MKKSAVVLITGIFSLSGCVIAENPCENIVISNEQIQECQSLQRQIEQLSNHPILRGELERRYQQDCVEIRYYRDDKQDAVCQNKEEIEELHKTP